MGLNKLTFTSSKVGIAVGVYTSMGGLDESVGSANLYRISASTTGSTAPNTLGANTGVVNYANILLTYDGAATWVRASGVPRLTGLQDLTTGAILLKKVGVVLGNQGTTGLAGTPPYPVRKGVRGALS